jgi:hypothetical protein
MLHLLGLDHEKRTFRHSGRATRLTDQTNPDHLGLLLLLSHLLLKQGTDPGKSERALLERSDLTRSMRGEAQSGRTASDSWVMRTTLALVAIHDPNPRSRIEIHRVRTIISPVSTTFPRCYPSDFGRPGKPFSHSIPRENLLLPRFGGSDTLFQLA